MKSPHMIRALFAVGALSTLLTQPLMAADADWKFYTYFAANDKPTALHRAFAEDVTKATGGRLKITVFASGELPYKASDVLRIVAGNQVEIGDVAFGFVATCLNSTHSRCPSRAPRWTSSTTRRCRLSARQSRR